MNVKEIVSDWLRSHGYDGLMDDNECGCLLDDLMPCGEYSGDCVAGHKVPGEPGSDVEFMVVA